MAEVLKDYLPPHAVSAWMDETSIYIALPTKSGPPYIQKFTGSENGLHKALTLMRSVHKRQGAPTYTIPTQSIIRRVEPFHEDARAKAREILKKAKII